MDGAFTSAAPRSDQPLQYDNKNMTLRDDLLGEEIQKNKQRLQSFDNHKYSRNILHSVSILTVIKNPIHHNMSYYDSEHILFSTCAYKHAHIENRGGSLCK